LKTSEWGEESKIIQKPYDYLNVP